ncbi:MAG: hypothetical protein PVSMB8_09540 [Vulcanimicrobiaceae bacterium]
MTPVARFLRNTWEKLFGKFYDGPAMPIRFADYVEVFAKRHPKATRQDWFEFSIELAARAYEAGYVRGWEADLRTEPAWQRLSPDDVADHLSPGWRENSRGIIENENGIVREDDPTDAERLQDHLEEIDAKPWIQRHD